MTMMTILGEVPSAGATPQIMFQHATYIFAAVCFILSLKWMSSPTTARRGNHIGEIGMAAAIVGALLQAGLSYEWITLGLVLGALIGAPLAIWMPMTAVPQRTAFSHACGALAAAVVGCAHYSVKLHEGGNVLDHISHATMAILCVEVLLGTLTFTGLLMATGKLQEILPQRPITFKGQNFLNFFILAAAAACGIGLAINPALWFLFPILLILALAFGVLLIIP